MNSLESIQDELESIKLSSQNSEIKEILDEIIFVLDLLAKEIQSPIEN